MTLTSINNMLKNVAKDTTIYGLGRVIIGIVGIFSIKLYTSLFSPDIFGTYSLINTTVNIAIMVLTGWLLHSGFRFSNEYETDEKNQSFYSTLFLCSIVITLISIILVGSVLKVLNSKIPGELSRLIITGALFLGTQSNSMILFNLIRAKRMSGLYTILGIVQSLFKLIMIYILSTFTKLGIESIFVSGMLLDILVSIPIIYKLKLVRHVKINHFSTNILRRFIVFGYPLIGVSITTWVLSTSDEYLIRIFRNAAEVGVYSISYKLVAAGFGLVNTSLMLGIYPIILKTWKEQGKKGTEKLMEKILGYYLIITLPTFVGLTVLAKPILKVLSSPGYIKGYTIMPWLALGMVFQGFTEYIVKVWELQENTKIIFKLMIIAGLINIIGNLIFIPIYGFRAAALTTAVSYLVYLLLVIYLSGKFFTWKFRIGSVFRTALAGSIMALVLRMFINIINRSTVYLILGIILGAIVYLVALCATGEIEEEISGVRMVLKNRRAK